MTVDDILKLELAIFVNKYIQKYNGKYLTYVNFRHFPDKPCSPEKAKEVYCVSKWPDFIEKAKNYNPKSKDKILDTISTPYISEEFLSLVKLPISIQSILNSKTFNYLFFGYTQYQKTNTVNIYIRDLSDHFLIVIPQYNEAKDDIIERLKYIRDSSKKYFKIIEVPTVAEETKSIKYYMDLMNESKCVFVMRGHHRRLKNSVVMDAILYRVEEKNDIILIRDESDLMADSQPVPEESNYTEVELAIKPYMYAFKKIIHLTATPITLVLRNDKIPDIILLQEPEFYMGFEKINYMNCSINKQQISDLQKNGDINGITSIFDNELRKGNDNCLLWMRLKKAQYAAKDQILKHYIDFAVMIINDEGIRLYYDNEISIHKNIQEASSFAYSKKTYLIYIAGNKLGRQMSISNKEGTLPLNNIIYYPITNKISNGARVIQFIGRITGSYPNANKYNHVWTTKELAKEIKAQFNAIKKIVSKLKDLNGKSFEEKQNILEDIRLYIKSAPVMKRHYAGWEIKNYSGVGRKSVIEIYKSEQEAFIAKGKDNIGISYYFSVPCVSEKKAEIIFKGETFTSKMGDDLNHMRELHKNHPNSGILMSRINVLSPDNVATKFKSQLERQEILDNFSFCLSPLGDGTYGLFSNDLQDYTGLRMAV